MRSVVSAAGGESVLLEAERRLRATADAENGGKICAEVRKTTRAVATKMMGMERSITMSTEALAELVRTAGPGQLEQPVQITLDQLQGLGGGCLGWRVVVESTEGSFVGHVCWVLNHCGRLGLEQVSRPHSGVRRRPGLLLLYYRCIHSVTLLGRRPPVAAAATAALTPRRDRSSLLMKRLATPRSVEQSVELEQEEQQQEEEQEKGEEEEEEELPPLPLPPGKMKRPNTWVIIDRLNDDYYSAVSAILCEPIVGVSAAGRRLGRGGQLAWLCLAAPASGKVFLFDVAKMGLHGALFGDGVGSGGGTSGGGGGGASGAGKGETGSSVGDSRDGGGNEINCNQDEALKQEKQECGSIFKMETATQCTLTTTTTNSIHNNHSPLSSNSTSSNHSNHHASYNHLDHHTNRAHRAHLRDVLCDGEVEKVLHDSRRLCDLLQHQADLIPCAIYDIQAAEVYLHQFHRRGDCPTFVRPLQPLLTGHLRLHPRHLRYMDRLSSKHPGDESIYFERPLPLYAPSCLAASAVFLCELRHCQLRLLTADLRQLNAVYATSHARHDDVTLSRVDEHVVPEQVQLLVRRSACNCRPPPAATPRPRNTTARPTGRGGQGWRGW